MFLVACHFALVAAMGSAAMAETEYPTRTIKIVVPLPPGPVADVVPRVIAEKLSAKWGQPVIVENRPGAALNLGAEAVAKAVPDGYTLLATPPGPLVVSQHLFSRLAFDPAAFAPVSVMVQVPAVLIVNPKVPAATLAELITYAKANPGKLSYGSPGTGNTPQLAMERLMAAAGIKFLHVPYQGLAPALRDLLGGHVDVMIDNLGNVMEHIKDGRVKLIAATGEARIPQFPDVPTLAETLPGVTHGDWFALAAPPKTPPQIAEKLSKGIAEVLRLPDLAKRMSELYVTPVGSSPGEAAVLIKQESARWQQVIASAGVKIE
jgi:tripartite-type tricarboxylate transporter receptor subunit TctC